MCRWADTHCCLRLVQQLGQLGSGWQPCSKIGEVGEPRRAAALVESSAFRRPGGQGGAQEQDRSVGDSIRGWRGGVAHWSSALHGGTDQSAGNNGEGGLPVVGVGSSWFGKVAIAQADDEVVAVGVGRGPRWLSMMSSARRMKQLVRLVERLPRLVASLADGNTA
jgi:hypothetical protein